MELVSSRFGRKLLVAGLCVLTIGSVSALEKIDDVVIEGSCASCAAAIDEFIRGRWNYGGGTTIASPPGGAPVTGDASEMLATADAAKKIAEGLVLPCPKSGEPDEIYIARAFQYCESTVKESFPIMTRIFPKIPPSACQLAGIQEKAGGVLAGIEKCG